MALFDDYDDHVDNWNEYLSNVNERYDEMYNLINYNQFTNIEIRRLDRKNSTLLSELEDYKTKYSDLYKKFETVKNDHWEMKTKYAEMYLHAVATQY